jgi:RNA polymerase sigma-70 factor (ECF subfamily)
VPLDENPGEGSSPGTGWFATTHWSVVLTAPQTASPAGHEALEKLCRAYWYPLYAYVRRRGYAPHDAEDLTQELFARLLADDFLEGVTAEKGKFRSFLLTVTNHFLANERDRAQTAKRGGGAPILSLDDPSFEQRYGLEPATEVTPAVLFDRRWAWAVLDQAIKRLRRQRCAGVLGQDLSDRRVVKLARIASQGRVRL